MLTHAEGKAALKHIMEIIFQMQSIDPLPKGLSELQFMDIRNVLNMDLTSTINGFTYQDTQENNILGPIE